MPTLGPNDILAGLITLLVGIVTAFLIKRLPRFDPEIEQQKGLQVLEQKKVEAREYLEKVRQQILQYRQNIEIHYQRLQQSVTNMEKVVQNKELHLQKHEQKNQELNTLLTQSKIDIKETKEKTTALQNGYVQALSEQCAIPQSQAKDILIGEMITPLEKNQLNAITRHEEFVKEESVRDAKNILLSAINRCAAATSVERKANVVKVPRDSFTTQLLGNNLESVHLIEKTLEADLIFNDTPDAITVSGFDLVKRHIATQTIEKLTKEKGPIFKEKIAKVIEDARSETNKIIDTEGKKACEIMKMKNVNPELIHIIGRLKFRTSYGQNILLHSLEVAFLAAILAGEIGAEIETAKIAGFLHDVGKAIDHEVNEPHDKLTKDIMTKYGFPEGMIHAAWAHHEAEPLRTPEAHIVKAADALSAGRPGARQESLEKYIERIQKLEAVASSFNGVKKTFAISAGREVRVIVDPETINDLLTDTLAGDIAHKIEAELTYPGKIKVNVIRTTRVTEYAN